MTTHIRLSSDAMLDIDARRGAYGMEFPKSCKRCEGTGGVATGEPATEAWLRKCPDCDGSGTVWAVVDGGKDAREMLAALKACVTAMEHPSHAVTKGAVKWAREVIAKAEGAT